MTEKPKSNQHAADPLSLAQQAGELLALKAAVKVMAKHLSTEHHWLHNEVSTELNQLLSDPETSDAARIAHEAALATVDVLFVK